MLETISHQNGVMKHKPSEKGSVCLTLTTTSQETRLLQVFMSELVSVCRLQISEEEL